jgi:hypothetical protein
VTAERTQDQDDDAGGRPEPARDGERITDVSPRPGRRIDPVDGA